ncbi:MAG: DUF2934 domain-containing protein [Chlorobiaceae bacterium]
MRLSTYYLWESKGRRNGWDIEDWLEAKILSKTDIYLIIANKATPKKTLESLSAY